MTRNGPDDVARNCSPEVQFIEGLLAYAASRRRWGGKALDAVAEAVVRSRALARECPGEHGELLVRCLRASAGELLRRRRAAEALPPAQEAVTIGRTLGGAPHTVALYTLAEVLDALHRYDEAAACLAEADRIIPPED